nr:MAG: hypothetical protein [Fish-associated picorna-like virus 4]
MEVLNQENPNNPTEIVSMDTTPNYLMDLTEQDLNNFTYTGISMKIKVPFVKNDDKAIFAINTDGFIPGITFQGDPFKKLMINLFPVQVFENALDMVEVYYEPIALPILHKYMSYRFCKGKPSICLRMSSNVGQTGNFQVVQASGLQRSYYSELREYEGLVFANADTTSSTFAPSGITLWDVSINRNLGIVPVTRENMPATDLMMKFLEVAGWELDNKTDIRIKQNIVTSQFLEEWLFFTPQNSFPNTNGGDIEISVYMDWSNVQFDMPGIPIQPITCRFPECQIMKFSETFNHKRLADLDFSTSANFKAQIKWLPGGPPPPKNEEIEAEPIEDEQPKNLNKNE